MLVPENPVMLLSFINTKLRDEFSSLDDFCDSFDVSKEEIISKLAGINYFYQEEYNQFK